MTSTSPPSSAQRPYDSSPPPPERPGGFSLRTLVTGSGWGLFSQFVPMGINIVLTPFVIHGFGLARYGVFMLVTALVAFLGRFDGGLTATTYRFLGILAGRDDRVGTTRLLCTVSVFVVMVATVLTTVAWVLAPAFSHLVSMPAWLRPEAIFLFRTLMALIGLGMIRTLLTGAIGARRRFALVSLLNTSMYVVYVLGIVLSVNNHWGLRGIAVTFVAQQILSIAVLLPVLFGYLDRHAIGFVSRAELREFLSYGVKLQLVGIAALVNDEVDTLIVGAVLAVRQVGLFEAGTNFAENVASIPVNALGPVSVMFANAFGRDGRPALDAQFGYLQRRWVQVITGWSAAALGAVWFGVTAWLGPHFDQSGTIAVVITAAGAVSLLPGVMGVYLQALGKPGIEARYAIVCMLLNIGLTIPLAFTGIIGIAAATGAANAIAVFYLLRLVRRGVGPDVPSFLTDVPVLSACLTAAVCVALELLIRPIVPQGPLGLLVSAIPAGLSLVVYSACVAGVRRTTVLVRHLPTFLRNPREVLVRTPG